MGESAVVVLEVLRVKLFKHACCSVMERAAALAQQGIVSNLLRERMLEAVFDLADRWLFVDEFTDLKLSEHSLEFVVRLAMTLSPKQWRSAQFRKEIAPRRSFTSAASVQDDRRRADELAESPTAGSLRALDPCSHLA